MDQTMQSQDAGDQVMIKKYDANSTCRNDVTTQTVELEKPRDDRQQHSVLSTTMPVTVSMTVDDASPIHPPSLRISSNERIEEQYADEIENSMT